MHGGAISLAKQFNELTEKPDLILATSMLDFTTFIALTREKSKGIPTAIYFHENQITYPWSPQDRDVKHKRDNHYGFINYTSALVSDSVLFNSVYHKNSFIDALPSFINQFPDKQGKENIELIAQKAKVLSLGLDLYKFEDVKRKAHQKNGDPIILWNHRWEYDKRPKEFFEALFTLKEKGIAFKLVVLGGQNDVNPPIFDEAKSKLSNEILHWGYVEHFKQYAEWLWKADILPVTSNQDFFGGSVVEAMYCNCYPILPNRLAYPDHLPDQLHSEHLYEEGELISKIEAAIQEVNLIRGREYKSLVEKYDWTKMIQEYDQSMYDIFNL
ncbi:MAG: DUF3524 domain-containing protein [Balneolaceae bacterium]